MSLAEVIATVVLGLLGLGVMAGQNFQLNGWTIFFWSLAALVLVAGLLHRKSADDNGSVLDLGRRIDPLIPGPTGSTLADIARHGGEIRFPGPRNSDDPLVTQMRDLLREAATMIRNMRVKATQNQVSSDEALSNVWVIHQVVPKFLFAAFRLPKWRDEYNGFMASQRERNLATKQYRGPARTSLKMQQAA